MTSFASACPGRCTLQHLSLPLLTDDGKFDGAPGHHAEVRHYP
jgi:hypothetical protein